MIETAYLKAINMFLNNIRSKVAAKLGKIAFRFEDDRYKLYYSPGTIQYREGFEVVDKEANKYLRIEYRARDMRDIIVTNIVPSKLGGCKKLEVVPNCWRWNAGVCIFCDNAKEPALVDKVEIIEITLELLDEAQRMFNEAFDHALKVIEEKSKAIIKEEQKTLAELILERNVWFPIKSYKQLKAVLTKLGLYP